MPDPHDTLPEPPLIDEEFGNEEVSLSELDAGSIVGRYRLLNLLGQGSIGRVYLAQHDRLGRQVALKLLRSEHASNRTVVRRFFDEARAVNRVAHQNIVEITDFVEDEDGRCYIIMEHLSGETLADRLKQGVLPEETARNIIRQVCSALQAAHEVGILHRDLKPENIFLSKRDGDRDFVKILDFGIAKFNKVDPDQVVQKTAAGTVLGTPEYMSPEQASANPIDERTDIYAIGVLLYEMLTAVRPFAAPTVVETLMKQLAFEAPPPATLPDLPQVIPPHLDQLIMRCLSKDREARPQSCSEVAALLEVAEIPPFETGAPSNRRWIVAFCAAVGAGLLTGGVGYFLVSRADPVPVINLASPSVIKIRFDSTPPGAVVRSVETGESLGKTPLEHAIERSDRFAQFDLTKEGFEPMRLTVPLRSTPPEQTVVLVPLTDRAKEDQSSSPRRTP